MIVYVVTSGTYSDYHIAGVYDNKEAAENYAFNMGATDWAEVEEYEMGSHCKRKGAMWCGFMCRDGTVDNAESGRACDNECILYYPDDDYEVYGHAKGNPYIYFRLRVPTLEHAVKIVNEKRAEMVATDFWDHPRGERIGGWENGTGGHFRIKGKI